MYINPAFQSFQQFNRFNTDARSSSSNRSTATLRSKRFRPEPVQMFKVQSFKGGTRSFFLRSAAFYSFHAAQPLDVALLAAY